MKLFRSKAEKELDMIIFEMKQFLQNNYKDLAHQNRKKLLERCEALYAEGKLSEEQYKEYRAIYEKYTVMLKDYRH